MEEMEMAHKKIVAIKVERLADGGREMATAQEIITTIQAEIADCERCARAEGYGGDDWTLTEADISSIEDALIGRYTRAELAAARDARDVVSDIETDGIIVRLIKLLD